MMQYGWNYVLGRREYTRGVATIYPYERGLLYRSGRLEKVLEAGRYRIWAFRHERIEVIDMRRTSAQVAGQKLLTRDQITVSLNLVADYEIADAVLAVQSVAKYQDRLHEDVQLAARSVVSALAVDELLEKRVEINAQMREIVTVAAATYGLNVTAVSIKDIMLAPRVRDLLMKEAEAKRVAGAMLIGAREEVAATRALVNAARLIAEHPELMRLRELEVARTFAGQGGNTLVMGLDGAVPAIASGGKQSEKRTAPQERDDSDDVTFYAD
jgi:regulator of protease activity HflC (stomatin/prohibitin superfamily)